MSAMFVMIDYGISYKPSYTLKTLLLRYQGVSGVQK